MSLVSTLENVDVDKGGGGFSVPDNSGQGGPKYGTNCGRHL